MKLSIAAALLIGATSFLSGQETPRAAWVGGPFIRDIETVSASNPGGVTVTGVDLGLVHQASLDGNPVAILHNTGTRLVLDPGPWAPGFASLELDHPTGALTGTVEMLPSLKVRRNHNKIQVTLNPGHRTVYWVHYSLACNDTMVDIPGVYYGQWLNMDGPNCGLYAIGHANQNEPLVFPWETVPDLGLIGALRLQAMCYAPETPNGDWCFTNLAIPR